MKYHSQVATKSISMEKCREAYIPLILNNPTFANRELIFDQHLCTVPIPSEGSNAATICKVKTLSYIIIYRNLKFNLIE